MVSKPLRKREQDSIFQKNNFLTEKLIDFDDFLIFSINVDFFGPPLEIHILRNPKPEIGFLLIFNWFSRIYENKIEP